MSMFSRLAGLAQKALDSSGATPSRQSGTSGQTDWRSVVQSAADALTGERRGAAPTAPVPAPAPADVRASSGGPARLSGAAAPAGAAVGAGTQADRAAVARYDYLLQTADPHQLEQVHREAFERLTPAQRSLVEGRMRAELPAHERPRSAGSEDLARAATRAEMTHPGALRGLLARVGVAGGRGRGAAGSGSAGAGLAGAGLAGAGLAGAGLAAGGVLAAVAGGAVLSSVAGPLLEQAAGLGVDFDALATGIDLEAIAGGADLGALAEGVGLDGLTGGVDELAAGAGETVSGLGEQVTGLGDRVSDFGSNFGLPGLGDLFNR